MRFFSTFDGQKISENHIMQMAREKLDDFIEVSVKMSPIGYLYAFARVHGVYVCVSHMWDTFLRMSIDTITEEFIIDAKGVDGFDMKAPVHRKNVEIVQAMGTDDDAWWTPPAQIVPEPVQNTVQNTADPFSDFLSDVDNGLFVVDEKRFTNETTEANDDSIEENESIDDWKVSREYRYIKYIQPLTTYCKENNISFIMNEEKYRIESDDDRFWDYVQQEYGEWYYSDNEY